MGEDGILVIDFSNGNPAVSTLPVTMVRQANDAMLQYMSSDLDLKSFSHPLHTGEKTDYFTEALATFLERRGDRVLPCAGVSDGLDRLITMLLKRSGFRQGGFVYVEEHTYIPAVQIFRDRNLRIRTVRGDHDGLDVDDLREKLQEVKDKSAETVDEWPLFVYVIPSFASPTGRIMSHKRRTELLALTRTHDVPVVTDEVYSLLDFSKELDLLRAKEQYRLHGTLPPEITRSPVVPLAEMGYSHVYSMGSFSKVLCPGLRVGWIETANDVDVLELKMLAAERSGGCMCQFTSCLVASILQL
ncbi:unnamed protein product, partial [Ectocarpus fasciculatus]